MSRAALFAVVWALVGCGRSPAWADFGGEGDGGGDAGTLRDCDGTSSRYALEVVNYDPEYGGGSEPNSAMFAEPTAALGAPDYTGGSSGTGAVALGYGGALSLSFGDCDATSGDATADLRVHEVGPLSEALIVDVRVAQGVALAEGRSRDAMGFVFAGVTDTSATVDLDACCREGGEPIVIEAVRLVDAVPQDRPGDNSPGADIDAVEWLN